MSIPLKKYLNYYLVPVAVLLFYEVAAQDIHFSQFYSSPLILNPAYTGIMNGDFRVTGHYKNQWKSIMQKGAFKTGAISFDVPVLEKGLSDALYRGGMGIGMYLYHDKAGDLGFGTTQANFCLAANKNLDFYNNISVGLQGGITFRTIDYSNIETENQVDKITGSFNNQPVSSDEKLASLEPYSYGDFATGILWTLTPEKGMRANLGLGVQHLSKPRQSFYQKEDISYMRFVANGGAEIAPRNIHMSFIPNFIILQQGAQREINVGTMIKYILQESSKYTGWVDETAIALGGWYRFGDAVIINGRLNYKNITFGLSYDINVSDLTAASSYKGGLEVSLTYIDHKGKRMKKARPLL
ncbi:MAG: PorP/SprF family type IX secretion system membrane protein [Bacteroidetes bacterium]|nr:PorP/SprF family type IX secretion system membrane protein [Bacteroidota bacterium]